MTIADRKLAARRLTDAKRIVVKVGSTLLVDAEKGRLNRSWLESLTAAELAAEHRRSELRAEQARTQSALDAQRVEDLFAR